MRKLFLALALTGAFGATAAPAVALDVTKPTGAACTHRVQSAAGHSAAAKALATTACKDRAAAIRAARTILRDAREAKHKQTQAARAKFRAALKAAPAKPSKERTAAIKAARSERHAALKSARTTLHTAVKTYRHAVAAAQKAFHEAMTKAHAA